jgi:hypothetical protein
MAVHLPGARGLGTRRYFSPGHNGLQGALHFAAPLTNYTGNPQLTDPSKALIELLAAWNPDDDTIDDRPATPTSSPPPTPRQWRMSRPRSPSAPPALLPKDGNPRPPPNSWPWSNRGPVSPRRSTGCRRHFEARCFASPMTPGSDSHGRPEGERRGSHRHPPRPPGRLATMKSPSDGLPSSPGPLARRRIRTGDRDSMTTLEEPTATDRQLESSPRDGAPLK